MTNDDDRNEYVIVLHCRERRGIVASVSGFLADHGLTIAESSQYSDQDGCVRLIKE